MGPKQEKNYIKGKTHYALYDKHMREATTSKNQQLRRTYFFFAGTHRWEQQEKDKHRAPRHTETTTAADTHTQTQYQHKHETRFPGWGFAKELSPPTSDMAKYLLLLLLVLLLSLLLLFIYKAATSVASLCKNLFLTEVVAA